MKRKYLYIGLLLMQTFALTSCSTSDSDEGKNGEGTLTINASVSGDDSRVTVESDATNGLLTKWEVNEPLKVYHNYLYNGAAQSMRSFTFNNTSSAATSGIFKYTGAGDYSFNSGNIVYAVNVLPGNSQFTEIIDENTLDYDVMINSQDGKLESLYKYDAMYGTTTATGTSNIGSISMHHLFAAVQIDFLNPDFTSSLSSLSFINPNVSIGYLLPGHYRFFIYSDGTKTTDSMTSSANASFQSIPASNGKASLYFMTYPFSSSGSGVYQLSVIATTQNGEYYAGLLDDKAPYTLIEGKMYKFSKSMKHVTPLETTYSYQPTMWDAPVGSTYSQGISNANLTALENELATRNCASCPSVDQIRKYLGAGVYYDPLTCYHYNRSGVTFTCIGGLWVMKDAEIPAGTTPVSSVIPYKGKPADTSKYFFLPAFGTSCGANFDFSRCGYYWSSIAASSSSATSQNHSSKRAFILYFTPSQAQVDTSYRDYEGEFAWTVQ